ncbi:unnamed protein product [Phyllotreta striolata]|uniref:DNA mismatch repair protein n=1 Tax=Phyllotreta striolata TaxID=444603 RepID=A0A9N9XJZ8_PHYSR|nr:unnamed protein product [Phyllotreta striolata]
MSKRQTSLLSYFTSPKVSKTSENKVKIQAENDSDDEIIVKKRPRKVVDEDDDDIEDNCKEPPTKRIQRSSSGSENENTSPNKSKKPKRRIARLDSSSESEGEGESKSKNSLKDLFKKGQAPPTDLKNDTPNRKIIEEKEAPIEVKDIHSIWLHNRLEFLKPDKIMDINKRKPDHPEYDSRTLFVPEKFLSGLTPAMRQWWELKSRHMDSVLFFKVGKFYELYHMDAVVGVTELNFSYMKGEFAHSGFPESAYGKMVAALIEKGYKVARVEQTETPDMMSERLKKAKSSTKFDKVVKREICQVSAKGSVVLTAQMANTQNSAPFYLFAICMKESSYGTARIGVCFIETTLGTVYLSEFDDDKHFSRLLALFAEYPPARILLEKGGINKQLNQLLNCNFKDIKKDFLLSKTQFHAASDTLEKLSNACYFRNSNNDFYWPEVFKKIADDCLPKSEYELTIRCIGASMWYLKDSFIDIQVFSSGKFEWYDPLDFVAKETKTQDYLLLDSVTIHNLDLLETKISLKNTLDRCQTAFGKRLLARWICRPLCDIKKIQERQNAIKCLYEKPSMLSNAQAVLAKMPDLERQLTKIHIFGNKFLSTDHPDGRAVFYEAKTYSKRKIKDFLKTLRAFEKAQEIADVFSDCDDRLLRKITQYEPKGVNVDLSEVLNHFKTAFDQEQAEKEGTIIPKRGVVDEFDGIENIIDNIKKNLDNYLESQCKFFGCKVSYVGNDKKRFQLEVPESKTHKVTKDYHMEGARKGAKPVKKYSTPTTRELLANMLEAEAERAKIILDLNRAIFEQFSAKHEQFDRVIQCLALLDVLCCLAEYARTFSQDICMPKVLPFDDKPSILIENGRHPCIPNIDSFVPNDTQLGVEDHPGILILTGPNMGGKSTLMRQIAVISIMAQIGSFVPASRCEMNLIDRIFTRLGAQDDILQGQSTFYVELAEASSILRHVTPRSLVVIDELGRGTSTHDGNAIATAYVKKLTEVKCRTMFSTHYHSLVSNFKASDDVQLTHMACMVEKDDDETEESVTFLYKLASGVCPKSYGFNAAKLAGMDRRIITRGRDIAKSMEEGNAIRNAFCSIFNQTDKLDVSSLREALLAVC